ncbi:fumarylacetoacetate hydrolase family protein [Pseudophaeobacter sp.]|uniref:fumarylacetoacetate hydrolase family protein n=1 Tax=Pseudophaeobacter sp. TaxID=1971739 RepID=UPI0032983302
MIRDLSRAVGDITGDVRSNSQLQGLRAFDPASVPLVEEVLDHVAGYCVVNDLSERDFQIHRSGQWVKSKSRDTFGPIGPWLVTGDKVPNPQDLDMYLEVNGRRHQTVSNFDSDHCHLASIAVHEPAAWRCDLNRDTSWRWHRATPRGLSQTRGPYGIRDSGAGGQSQKVLASAWSDRRGREQYWLPRSEW